MWKRQIHLRKKQKKAAYTLRPETALLVKQLCLGLASISFVCLLLWGFWHGTRLPQVTILSIEVTGGYTISHDDVRRRAADVMVGNYVKLIPRTFTFTYPKDDIIRAVSEIDKLKHAYVKRLSWQTLQIKIEEYVPFALWCKDREGQYCYFIDESGVAFIEAPVLNGSAFLRYRTVGRIPERFSTLTEKEQLQTVLFLVTALEDNFNFLVMSVELDVVGDVFFILSGGSEIKVSKRLTTEETIRNLQAVLSAPEFRDLRPGDFPYIDLRFGNKVFVSDEWPTVTTPETEILLPELVSANDNVISALISDVTDAILPEETLEEEIVDGGDSFNNESISIIEVPEDEEW